MNWMVLPNQVCLIVKLYNNRPGLLPDSNGFFKEKTDFGKPKRCFYHIRSNWVQLITIELAIENSL